MKKGGTSGKGRHVRDKADKAKQDGWGVFLSFRCPSWEKMAGGKEPQGWYLTVRTVVLLLIEITEHLNKKGIEALIKAIQSLFCLPLIILKCF